MKTFMQIVLISIFFSGTVRGAEAPPWLMKFDTDGDGRLSLEENNAGWKELKGSEFDQTKATSFFKWKDTNHDGFLSGEKSQPKTEKPSPQDEMIENGDFSKGSSRWTGNKEIVYETPAKKNKVCKVETDENDHTGFSQKITTRGVRRLTVKFRIKKSRDYDSENPNWPCKVYFKKTKDGPGKYLGHFQPEKRLKNIWGYDWVDVEGTIVLSKKSSSGYLTFGVSGFSGYVMFDDISVTAQ